MLEQNVYEFIKKYQLIEDGDKIVLGVSGGPDSICMLNILNEIMKKGLINFEIFVAHINHGIRENAIYDEKFVMQFCENLSVPFFVEHADVKKKAQDEKRGLEETGRIVRYNFFDEILKKTGSNKIAIAHNKNDKVETMIMNALRGSGLKGLIAIQAKNGKYIRPLLEIKRDRIEEYLENKNIKARRDESNDDNIYTRNKIRNVVIPYIQKEFNPNIIDTFVRLSDIIDEEEIYLQKQTENAYNEVCLEEINLTQNYEHNNMNNAKIIMDLKKFNQLEEEIQKRVIFFSINKIFGTTKGIEKIHIDDIIKLCHNNVGNKYLSPNKFMKVLIENKKIKIIAM